MAQDIPGIQALKHDALAFAAQMDEERAAGAELGPLHGIPVPFKNNIATGDGMATTAGADVLRDWHADHDAFLVQQLRDAGAIILGKANLSEEIWNKVILTAELFDPLHDCRIRRSAEKQCLIRT